MVRLIVAAVVLGGGCAKMPADPAVEPGRARKRLAPCYEAALEVAPDLEGRIEVAWVIEGGRVSSARIVSDTVGHDGMARCVLRRVERFRFDDDAAGEVTWPFVFRRR